MGPWQLGELTVEEPRKQAGASVVVQGSRNNRGLHPGQSGKQGLIQDTSWREFPVGLVVRAPCSHCQWPGSIPA